MATYFLRTRTGKAATGAGKKHAEYISGQDKYADKNEVQAVVDKNLPKWAKDGVDFFKKADENERSNGRSYRSLTIAIPREATDKAQWAQAFVDDLLKDGHAYRLAIHDKGDGNPHAHLMFSERGRNFENGDDPKDYFTRKNGKDAAFKSKHWLKDAKALYLTHVQKVAPDFEWTPETKSGEQHIGPKVKNAGFEFEVARTKRAWDVQELRGAKSELATVTAEIEQLERQQQQTEFFKGAMDVLTFASGQKPQEATPQPAQATNASPGTPTPTTPEKTPQTPESSPTESKPAADPAPKAGKGAGPKSQGGGKINWGKMEQESPGIANILKTMMSVKGDGGGSAAFAQSFAIVFSSMLEHQGAVKQIDAFYNGRRKQEEAKISMPNGGTIRGVRETAIKDTARWYQQQVNQQRTHRQQAQQQAQQPQPRPAPAAPRPSWAK
jgi:hypothetical protein